MRLVVLPLLLLLSLGFLVLLGWLVSWVGIFEYNPILANPLTCSLGITGTILRVILLIEGVIAFFLLIAAIPLGFLFRDVRKTLRRHNVFRPEEEPAKEADAPYLEASRRVFEGDLEVAVFIYGHTHIASLKEVDGKVVINTGTWLKLPKKVSVLFGWLPPVYYPSFHLNYFKIAEEEGKVTIYYERIGKAPPSELTLTQRLLTLTRRRAQENSIPERTVVGA